MDYRLLLAPLRAEHAVTFTAQVDTGNADPDWVTIEQWDAHAPARLTPKTRHQLAHREGELHGWKPLGENWDETDTERRTIIPAEPADWRRVLAAAIKNRGDHRAAYESADRAWQMLVAQTPRKGEDGYVGAIEIAEMAGMTRHGIYKIQDHPKGIKDAPAGPTVPRP